MHSQPEAPRVLAHVADNVRRHRITLGLSQKDLAERAGISRRTVISLEAGEANISLSGLDRLADALDTSFVALVAAPTAEPAAINEVAWRGADPASLALLLGAAPARTEAQLWSWSLAPGERYDAEPDPDGWHEMILVTEGELTVARDDGTSVLAAGDHVTYSSAQQYSYANAGATIVRFVRVVVS
ncbi:helix-turn-helix domain-containing protein [Curtobacterium ammoniigenes]|uniref:helix-turn-helix domain-containing protein n=1 Tax=Curtobacterium ammoniigenes TaxID=395387 RepID=UPI00082DD43D|nr:XRE family transcriptional regulator [Curtobacterium ammoniigenes]